MKFQLVGLHHKPLVSLVPLIRINLNQLLVRRRNEHESALVMAHFVGICIDRGLILHLFSFIEMEVLSFHVILLWHTFVGSLPMMISRLPFKVVVKSAHPVRNIFRVLIRAILLIPFEQCPFQVKIVSSVCFACYNSHQANRGKIRPHSGHIKRLIKRFCFKNIII